MKIVKNKSKVNYLLFFVILLVWGLIIYKIITYFIGDETEDDIELSLEEDYSQSNEYKNQNQDIIRSNFSTIRRDPFSFISNKYISDTLTIPIKEKVEIPVVTPPKIQLQYSINGIIISDGRKVILFEDITKGTSNYLREGETYENIKIVQILDNKVILLEDKEKKEIYVNK